MKVFYGIFNIEVRNGEFICFHMETSAGTWEKARSNFAYRMKQLYPKYTFTELYNCLSDDNEGKSFVIIPFSQREWKEFRQKFN